MQIRPMTLRDYDAVYALWLSCKGMGLNSVDDSREGIARFLTRNPSTCFAAEESGRIIGVIMAGHDGRRGYIYHTAVHPDFRSRGIGAALVDAALNALKAEGIAKAALVVFSRNETGNAFWEKMGFTERTDLTYRNQALTEMERMDT
ncbi:MAG: GNAT family N-acetyltransferase [Clostridia bacterium]|nr:GNAT family N-acetyltransferase [Clostridia bacterium]